MFFLYISSTRFFVFISTEKFFKFLKKHPKYFLLESVDVAVQKSPIFLVLLLIKFIFLCLLNFVFLYLIKISLTDNPSLEIVLSILLFYYFLL